MSIENQQSSAGRLLRETQNVQMRRTVGNKRWEDFFPAPEFFRRYPLYAYIIAQLVLVENSQVQVMAVSWSGGRWYLHVNVDYFLGSPKNVQYVAGVLLHEVHHIVLGHVTDPRFLYAAHPALMQLAMEMSANEFITEPLPGKPVLWSDYQRYGIGAGQSTWERYELLCRARRNGAQIVPVDPLDTHLPDGVGPRPLRQAGLGPGSADVSRLIRHADNLARRDGVAGTQVAGKDPGSLLEELESHPDRPPALMDWKAALRMFADFLRGPVYCYHRPNRRFPHQVGYIPGRAYLPRTMDKPNLLVVIDTSASMSTQELNDIAAQLLLLKDLIRMTVVECDAAIQRVYPFNGRLDSVMGRGGTDLRPVFAPEFLSQHPADGIIYFTDGEGPFLEDDPGVPTLWVLTKSDSFPCPWGHKARMNVAGGLKENRWLGGHAMS